MDIKSKNIKYSIGLKATAAILLWLCVMGALGSSFFMLFNVETITSKSYYETINFRYEFSSLVHDVVELNVKLKSEENIKASGQAQNVISQNLSRLNDIKYNLSNTVNFAYVIENTQTKEIVTNVQSGDALTLIKKQPHSIYANQWNPPNYYYFQSETGQMLTNSPYKVYAAMVEPLKPGDKFYDDFTVYSRVKWFLPYAIALLIASIILIITTFIYLTSVTGRSKKGGEIVLAFTDRIYTDVHTVLVFFVVLLSIAGINGGTKGNFIESLITASIIFSIDVFIFLSYVLSMTRQIKTGRILKNTLILKTFIFLKAFFKLCFKGRIFKVWTLLLLLGYGAVNAVLFAIAACSSPDRFLFLMLLLAAFNASAIYFGAKALLSLTKIMEAAKEISAGNLDYPLNSSNISVAFSFFAEDIKNIQDGLKKAVAQAVKGERMKTDLITNVSHDLKTPLTSIINYVDLLKKEDLNNEKACEYVGILEEKSARLKQLIEDLVEASKASSGSLTVKGEKVDLHELVIQACGEYEEKINMAQLDVYIIAGEDKTLLFADGRHMWRIIENLLSNVVKYSMPHTRVYIHIDKNDDNGLLTIKNISSLPLNISPDQLTERFVRGDASRATEGSGLGLSIAQSLTNLQGGRFNIDIDGDLFKVTVEIPLWTDK